MGSNTESQTKSPDESKNGSSSKAPKIGIESNLLKSSTSKNSNNASSNKPSSATIPKSKNHKSSKSANSTDPIKDSLSKTRDKIFEIQQHYLHLLQICCKVRAPNQPMLYVRLLTKLSEIPELIMKAT